MYCQSLHACFTSQKNRRALLPLILFDKSQLHIFLAALRTQHKVCRAPILGPTDFAVDLKAWLDKESGTCPFDGSTEMPHESEVEETD
jgi:hypothetical protein